MASPINRIPILKRLRSRDSLAYIILVGVLGMIYWRTLLPTMGTWGDAAKMQFLGKVLGTPHVSGTPLYLILNHLFVTYFPKGTLAYKANLLSAVFTLAALCFLLAALRQIGVRPAAALAACLTLGLGYTLWSWSLVAEVYTLNILLLCATLFFLLRWRNTRRDLDFYAACFAYALSFSNHLTTVLFLPAFAYMVWAVDRKTFVTPRKILVVGLIVLVCALPYSYIYWRTQDPTTAYLETSWSKFLDFLTSQNGRGNAVFREVQIYERLSLMGGFLWRDTYGILLLLAAWGFFQIQDRTVRRFLGIFSLVQAIMLFNMYAREYEVYFLPLYVALTFFIAAGMDWIAGRVFRNSYATAALFVVPLALLVINYNQVDQSERTLHARITEKVLATVDHDALILAPEYDYTCFYLYYLLGEGYSARNLYAAHFDYANPEAVRSYLEGRQSIYLGPQRQYVPTGLKVYAMEPVDRILREQGLEVRPTSSRYISEITLPQAR
jgi:hypothetical protein